MIVDVIEEIKQLALKKLNEYNKAHGSDGRYISSGGGVTGGNIAPSPDITQLKRNIPVLSMITDAKDKVKIEALHRYLAYSSAYYEARANSSSAKNKTIRETYAKKAGELAIKMDAAKEHAIKSGASSKEIGGSEINRGRSTLVTTKEFGEFHIYTVPGENKSLKRW